MQWPWFKRTESWCRPQSFWEFVQNMCCINTEYWFSIYILQPMSATAAESNTYKQLDVNDECRLCLRSYFGGGVQNILSKMDRLKLDWHFYMWLKTHFTEPLKPTVLYLYYWFSVKYSFNLFFRHILCSCGQDDTSLTYNRADIT